MCIVDGSPVVLTNASAPGPNGTTIYTPSYSTLDASTLAVQASHELYVVGNSTYTGRLAYPSVQNPYSIESPFIIASAGNGLTQTVDINLNFPGVALQTILGPNVSATFGTVGPTVGGDGYTWSGFSGSLGTGVFASDGSLNPLIQYGFTTPAAIGGIAFQNASLYYSASNVLYRHDPLTDQTLAQSAALPDIYGDLAVGPETPGDVNFDGHVDASDITAMLAALTDPIDYEKNHSLVDGDLLTAGDVNGDGNFNNADLQALLNLLKSGQGSSTAVPEPSTLALLALGSLGLLVRRKLACSVIHR
jgi:hypothetical protein